MDAINQLTALLEIYYLHPELTIIWYDPINGTYFIAARDDMRPRQAGLYPLSDCSQSAPTSPTLPLATYIAEHTESMLEGAKIIA